MSVQRLLQVGAVVAVVAGILGWSIFHHPANDPDHPNGIWWVCDKGHSFQMTTRELSNFYEKHWGQRVPCPICGSRETVRAYKCPKCGTVYPSHGAKKCPHCGAPAPADE